MNAKIIKSMTGVCGLVNLALLAGCGGGGGGGGTSTPTPAQGMQIVMHDSPAPYRSVTVTLSEIDVVDGGGQVTVLTSTPQTFDLLSLQNGTEKTIATDATLAPGTYSKIVVKVSAASLVDTNGNTSSITLPAGLSNGITVSGSFTVSSDTLTTVTLDFDALDSISVSTASSTTTYTLAPVLVVVPPSTAPEPGTISGTVADATGAMLVAAEGNDPPSVSLYPRGQSGVAGVPAVARAAINLSTGAYSFEDVPAGSYDLVFTALGYVSATVSPVTVTSGGNTSVPAEQLTSTANLPPPPPLARRHE